ncbi:class I SAM-dependent methyltransferase [Oricola sp.]|uniref:class I SAM-dependent methyltransferase n=1 Tax=Oricola sp. TaxID=1979950 RepID=UPI003BA95C8F
MTVKIIIDRQQVQANRRRAAAAGVDGADFLLNAIAQDAALRLSTVARQFENAVLRLPDSARGLTVPDFGGHVGQPATEYDTAGGADDEMPFAEPESRDLVIDLLTLHEINDLPGVLALMRRSLRPDGLFMACVPGGDTLHELRASLLAAEAELSGAAHARVLPFIDVQDAGGLLQRAGYALPVVDRESLTARYDTMFHLMRDLRAMGATNTLVSRRKAFTGRELFVRAAQIYARDHADADGRIRATFTFIWMSGWVPHASQQKPLKPGSAVKRLSEALNDRSEDMN